MRHLRKELTLRPKRPLKITIATMNISSYLPKKGLTIRRIMEDYKVDVMVLTETCERLHKMVPGIGDPLLMVGEASSRDGVAIVYNTKKKMTLGKRESRIIELEMEHGIKIIGAYGPTEQTPQRDRSTYWEKLEREIQNAKETSRTTILIGDLNAGHERIKSGTKTYGEPNYAKLMNLSTTQEMMILPSDATWQSIRSVQPTRTLDRCLIATDLEYSYVVKLDWEAAVADHAALIAEITFTDLDRSIGRVRTEKVQETWIEEQWNSAKLHLQKIPRQPPKESNVLQTFWTAQKQDDLMKRETLVITDDDDTPLTPREAAQKCADYLRSICGCAEEVDMQYTANATETTSPALTEITTAIKSLNKDAAKGLDNIDAGNLQADSSAARVYQKILHAIWHSGSLPRHWKDVRLKPIVKKTSRTPPHATRPITCLSTSTKILNTILKNRNESTYEKALHKNQYAYRSKRSVWTAIKELLAVIRSKGKCAVAVLDMSKAFDCVKREALSNALHKWGLPKTEATLIIEQYRDSRIITELNGITAKPFQHRRGIHQGCTLSGMLWNLVIATMHEDIDRIYASNKTGSVLSYADDIMVVADDTETTDRMTADIERLLQPTGLALNREKTIKLNFDIDGAETTTLKWLGTTFADNLNWDNEANIRIKRSIEAADKIRNVCKSKSILLPAPLMLTVLQTMVATHITAGGKTINFTAAQDGKMRNALLQAILKNTNLTESTAEKEVEKWMREKEKQQESEIRKQDREDRTALDRSALAEVGGEPQPLKLVSPTVDEILRRMGVLKQFKEAATTCKLCPTPQQVKTPELLKEHMTAKHGVTLNTAAEINCAICHRYLDAKAYVRHRCLLADHPGDTNRVQESTGSRTRGDPRKTPTVSMSLK